MPPIKISVVTPSYNQASFLEQTIQSVLSQDYPHVEYIVMDGGSTDGSVDILRKYSDRLTYWKSEKDEGQTDAIEKGFQSASGDIFYWLASDDLLLPGALSAVAKYFEENPQTEVVNGGAYYIDAKGCPLRKTFGSFSLGIRATHSRLRFYEQDGVFQQATFWRREAHEAVGGHDRSLQFIMDRDLYLRLARRRQFDRLPQMLACFRLHEDCKSSQIQHIRQEETAEFDKRYGTAQYGRFVRSALYYRYRIPSLLRKSWLGMRLLVGNIKLKKVG